MLEQRRRRWRRLLREVEGWARWLAEKLAAQGIRVEEILLFGSVARGDYKVDSDVDLIVVSEDWGRMQYLDRLSLLYRLWDKPRDATLIPFTRGELERRVRRSVALRDAARYWVRVYPAGLGEGGGGGEPASEKRRGPGRVVGYEDVV